MRESNVGSLPFSSRVQRLLIDFKKFHVCHYERDESASLAVNKSVSQGSRSLFSSTVSDEMVFLAGGRGSESPPDGPPDGTKNQECSCQLRAKFIITCKHLQE